MRFFSISWVELNLAILPYFAAKGWTSLLCTHKVTFQNQSTHSIRKFEISRAAALCFVNVIAKVLRCNYVLLIVQFLLATWFPFFFESISFESFVSDQLFRLCSVCFCFFATYYYYFYYCNYGVSFWLSPRWWPQTIRYARLQVSYSVVSVRVERFHLRQGDFAARYVEDED